MKEAWHLFKIRRALLTAENLSYAVEGVPNFVIRLPEIQAAAASILYVNAVSLLDDGIKTRLTPKELRVNNTLDKRLKALRGRGDLQDYDVLDRIRVRRNEIGHEVDKDATAEELDHACAAIQRELVAWGLVLDEPPYSVGWERSAARLQPEDSDIAFEQDRILRVMRGTEWVMENKVTVKFSRITK
jgi:hypothetical protein